VGGCVLEIRPDDGEIAELSYWVFPPYRRRGYATRSVGLMCRYAFDRLGIARVELCIEPTIDASLRVATKAGFVQEGVLGFGQIAPTGASAGAQDVPPVMAGQVGGSDSAIALRARAAPGSRSGPAARERRDGDDQSPHHRYLDLRQLGNGAALGP
jgi:hypothetical protein